MKVTKQGKVRLEKGEVRVGNFFIRDEGDNKHIRIADINHYFTLRVWKRMPLGIWLSGMMAKVDDGVESLKAFVSMMWSAFAVVPDNDFVNGILGASKEAFARHPEWYGAKKKEEDGDGDA